VTVTRLQVPIAFVESLMQVLIFNVLSWSKLIDLQLGAVRGALAPLDVYRAVGNHGDIV
jgi:hypothetical protein